VEAFQFLTEAQLWNAIVRHFGMALPLPAGQVTLVEATVPDPQAPRAVVSVGPDIALTLVLDSFPFARLTGVDLTLDEVRALPPVLSEGLILGAMEALHAALPPSLTGQVTLAGQLGGPERAMWLSATLDLGQGATATCRIGGRQQDFVQVLSRLFPGAAGHLPALPPALLTGLSTGFALIVGEVALPVATVMTLEPGDVVLAPIRIDERRFQVGRHRVVARAAAPTEDGGLAPSGWTVKEIRMTADHPEAETAAVSLDDVPLTLRFVTEDQRLSLADLQGLAAGAVLPFDIAPLTAGLPVRIQANGMTIGDGHIVQIDDSFAVRIARMAARQA
jgi:flagellar motor switch/type III secretory pathway protein FliN